ncbi:MAG: response regulator [Deltaproteobacteria bacterium]|nr:response regulator [Deltaproteobacteria bacterium]MBW2017103.1 response regulator [Deltaproteobacteria bacterium]MBW2302990.1 response regulator [Deltaproteobacteria bacterium]
MSMQENSSDEFKTKVLVVDDEKHIRDGCRQLLSKDGFQVAAAEDGKTALERIEQEHFDIVLLDLMMPGISGIEALARIKSLHPDTVVIVITGYATLDHAIETMKNGAFDFVSKPFSPQDLRLVISKAIDHLQTLRDITHEKSRMRVLINHLTDGVLATDREKKIALVNPAFLRMIGYFGKEATGRPAGEVLPDPLMERMIEQALSMPKDEFSELREEITYHPLDETEELILDVRCVPFRDRVGRNLGSIMLLHDITTLKKMDQMKSDLVSMVAHEIRGPLNTVLMQIKLIVDGLAGVVTEKQKEILDRTSDRLKSLVHLTSELLDLAKIESGLITQEKEKVDLAPILADQVAFFQPRAGAKGIQLDLEAPPELPPVLANKNSIIEVITNLISNAIKYTPDKGRVTVSAGTENGSIFIRVEDTGIGIEEEEVDHIMERFYRVKNDKTRFISGTGLGLAIVNSIVKAHHGKIIVKSKVDEGSTFTVYLPIFSS